MRLTPILLATFGLTTAAQANCAALEMVLQALPDPGMTSLGSPDTCGTARSTNGAVQSYCAWSFPLKSAEARQIYEQLSATLPGCDYAALDQDPQAAVNHPDSFAQRLYENDQRLISLSLKDKSALNASYIFLRVEPK